MSIRMLTAATVILLALFIASPAARADILTLKNGATVEGIIKKVEAGNVYVLVDKEEETYNILEIESMDFNTPHLLADATNVPLEHFMKDIEAQEMVRNIEQLEKSSADIRRKLEHVRTYWGAGEPITAKEKKIWDATKEDFRKPLALYQELLNDLYFHVLAKVDEYNALTAEARKVYVGVKGIRIGSSLITSDMQKLPLRKYVPTAWYDTIFYEGYNRGYDDAFQRMTGNR